MQDWLVSQSESFWQASCKSDELRGKESLDAEFKSDGSEIGFSKSEGEELVQPTNNKSRNSKAGRKKRIVN